MWVLSAPTWRVVRAFSTTYGAELARNCLAPASTLEPTWPAKLLKTKKLEFGGEGGIRTRQDPLDSVSYRFYIARIAVNARDAVAPCPLLPARSGLLINESLHSALPVNEPVFRVSACECVRPVSETARRPADTTGEREANHDSRINTAARTSIRTSALPASGARG